MESVVPTVRPRPTKVNRAVSIRQRLQQWAKGRIHAVKHQGQPPTSRYRSQQDGQEHPPSDEPPLKMESDGHLVQSEQPLIERVAPGLDKRDEPKPEGNAPKRVRDAQGTSPIVTWLSPIDVQATESTILASRASVVGNETTPRLALLPQAWASGRTKSPVLWVHGLPKTGKTTYTASVAKHLRDTAGPRDGVAAVYCNEEGSTAHALLSSICAQLASQVEQLPSLLIKLHAELASDQRPDIDAITLVMMALCDGFDRVFVCVDALDELDREGERPVLLKRLQWMRNRSVRLFVSSQTHGDRPERCGCNEDIETALEGANEMLIEAAEDDIRQSVTARLHAVPDHTTLLANAGEEDLDAVIEDAVRGCEGSFELAHLYLDRRIRELQPSLHANQVAMPDEYEAKPLFYARALVDNIPSYAGGLPFRKGDIITVTRVEHENSWKGRTRGMVGSFAQVHAKKVDDPSAGASLSAASLRRGRLRLHAILGGNPRRRDFALVILGWVAHARQPLHSDDMVQVLSLAPRDGPGYQVWRHDGRVFIEGCDGEPVDSTRPGEAGPPAGAVEITSIVAPLVQINAEDGTLSLHQWEPSASELRGLFPQAHLTMATLCLQVLIATLDRQATKPQPVLGRPRKPFLTYAEDNWGYHASLCQASSSLDALALEYLAKAYKSPPSWIEEREPLFRDAYRVLVTDDETPLLKAARHGLNGVLRVLLEGQNYDVNAVSYQNETALAVAVTAGFPSTAHLLHRYGASIQYRNGYGESLLHIAAARNDDIMVALLISCGLGPDTKCAGFRSYTALHNAIAAQCLDAVKMLVSRGAEVTGESMDEAAKSGHLDMVKFLVESQDSLLVQGSASRRIPLLLSAVASGSIPLVDYMLRRGARIDQLDHQRRNVLHCAAGVEDAAMVRFLFENAPDPMMAFTESDGPNEVCDGMTAVEEAVCRYQHGELGLEIGNYLLSRMPPGVANHTLLGMAAGFVSVDATDLAERVIALASGSLSHARLYARNSLLGAVIEKRNERLLRILLGRGMDAGAQDGEGWAPLHVAACSNSAVTVEALLEYGADINARTAYAMTPVHVAVFKGNLETLRVLLNHHPDLSLGADDGSTPLVAAGCSKQLGAARLLLDHDCDVNAANIDGESILHYAVMDGDCELARTLLDRGIDTSIMSRRGGTALQYAAYKGNLELVTMLLDSGAFAGHAYEYDGKGYEPPDAYGSTGVLLWNQCGLERADRPRRWGTVMKGWTAMHSAACTGSAQVLSRLIASGADISARGAEGETPLHVAASGAHAASVKLLAETGAGLDVLTDAGETALHWAARATGAAAAKEAGDHFKCCCKREKEAKQEQAHPDHSKSECVAMLLDLGADAAVENRDGASPLAVAVVAGHDDVVDVLVRHQHQRVGSSSGSTLDPAAYASLVRASRNSGSAAALERVSGFFAAETPESKDAWGEVLCAACVAGNGAMATLAIRKGGRLRTWTDDGKNPLHEVIARDDDVLLKQLLEAGCGADVKATDSRGRSSLHLVVSNRDGDGQGLTVFHGKAQRRNMVEMLVAAGALPNERTPSEGDTALHIGVGTGDPQAVEALLACGASVDIRNARGRTPVHAAASRHPFPEIVAALLRHHGCATAADAEGYTPLHLLPGKREEAVDVLDRLVRAGADVSAPAANGDRPLHCAVRRGNWTVGKRLVELGAGVHQPGAKGRTALHVAARYGHVTIVEHLLAAGARVGALDARAWAAAHHAADRGHAEVLKVLLRTAERTAVDVSGGSSVVLDMTVPSRGKDGNGDDGAPEKQGQRGGRGTLASTGKQVPENTSTSETLATILGCPVSG